MLHRKGALSLGSGGLADAGGRMLEKRDHRDRTWIRPCGLELRIAKFLEEDGAIARNVLGRSRGAEMSSPGLSPVIARITSRSGHLSHMSASEADKDRPP